MAAVDWTARTAAGEDLLPETEPLEYEDILILSSTSLGQDCELGHLWFWGGRRWCWFQLLHRPHHSH